MMNHEVESVVTTRDVVAKLIPVGTPITITEGSMVTITQALGGTFTVNVNGNLARIESENADALGKEVQDLNLEGDPEGAVNEAQIWEMLRSCYDPEIPVNIVDLGLIYECKISKNEFGKNHIFVVMTLTAPGCGMGPVLADEVKSKLLVVPNVDEVDVELTFDPPWDRDMLSEEAKLQLGMF